MNNGNKMIKQKLSKSSRCSKFFNEFKTCMKAETHYRYTSDSFTNTQIKHDTYYNKILKEEILLLFMQLSFFIPVPSLGSIVSNKESNKESSSIY